MARQVTKEVLALHRRFERYRDARLIGFDRRAVENERFFHNEQWTPEEKAEFKMRNQAPININRITPGIMHQHAIITANPHRFDAMPGEDSDVRMKHIVEQLFDYTYYISDGREQVSAAALNFLSVGIGYFHSFIDPASDEGRGDPKFEYLPWMDVFVDENSRKRDFSDAASIIISTVRSRAQLLNLFPEMASKIRRANDPYKGLENVTRDTVEVPYLESFAFQNDDEDNSERIRDFIEYTKVREVRYMVTLLDDKNMPTEEQAMTQAEYDMVRAKFPDRVADVYRVYTTRYKMVYVVGDIKLYESFIDVPHYPVQPIINVHVGTPYPLGDIDFAKDMQKEANKRRSQMIAYVTAAINNKLFYYGGSVADEDELQTKWGQPNATIRLNPGFDPPVPVHPSSLPEGLFNLEGMAKEDMQYAMGVFALQQGDASVAPSTHASTLAIEEFASRRQRAKEASIEAAITRIGQNLMAMYKMVYTGPKTFRIVNPSKDMLNEQQQQQINVPLYNDMTGAIVGFMNDIRMANFDVRVRPGSSNPTNRFAMLQEAKALYDSQVIDDVEVLKKVDGVFDREGVLKRKGIMNQQAQQLQAQQEELNKQNADIQRLEQMLADAKRAIELERYKGTLAKSLIRGDDEKQKALLRLKELEADLKIARKQAQDDRVRNNQKSKES